MLMVQKILPKQQTKVEKPSRKNIHYKQVRVSQKAKDLNLKILNLTIDMILLRNNISFYFLINILYYIVFYYF